MRKFLLIVLIMALLCCVFSSCAANKAEIEDHEWSMSYIVHVENDQVIYDAVSEENDKASESKVIDMTLVASNGKIKITDKTNGKIYEGTYIIDSKTPDGINYQITIGEKSGLASVAMTTYADGTKVPTLPINLDGYTICFYAK